MIEVASPLTSLAVTPAVRPIDFSTEVVAAVTFCDSLNSPMPVLTAKTTAPIPAAPAASPAVRPRFEKLRPRPLVVDCVELIARLSERASPMISTSRRLAIVHLLQDQDGDQVPHRADDQRQVGQTQNPLRLPSENGQCRDRPSDHKQRQR